MSRSEQIPPTPDPQQVRVRLEFSDEKLLGDCEQDTYRVSGPGGQHRNKVSSGVRLRHRLTGLVVTATERRSQHENRAQALHRLREAIAVECRAPLPQQVSWPEGVQVTDGRLRVNPRNPAYPQVIALVLDAVAAFGGELPKAAAWLGVSTSSLSRFLSEHPRMWVAANRIRADAGLPALKK